MNRQINAVKNTRAAFHFIIKLLQKHSVTYRIAGGLAAKIYGTPRPLQDLDFEVPTQALPLLSRELASFITFGPARYTDENWDLELLTLVYKNQEIDLAGIHHARFFDQTLQRWTAINTDLRTHTQAQVFNLSVPIMTKAELVAEKQKIARDVDLYDVAYLLAHPSPNPLRYPQG
jgi:hypothetical protein